MISRTILPAIRQHLELLNSSQNLPGSTQRYPKREATLPSDTKNSAAKDDVSSKLNSNKTDGLIQLNILLETGVHLHYTQLASGIEYIQLRIDIDRSGVGVV